MPSLPAPLLPVCKHTQHHTQHHTQPCTHSTPPRCRAGWDTFLLPPPAEVAELLAAPPPPRSPGSRVPPQVPPLPLVDREAVEGMLTEARRVVRSDRFHDTLVVSARWVAGAGSKDVCG